MPSDRHGRAGLRPLTGRARFGLAGAIRRRLRRGVRQSMVVVPRSRWLLWVAPLPLLAIVLLVVAGGLVGHYRASQALQAQIETQARLHEQDRRELLERLTHSDVRRDVAHASVDLLQQQLLSLQEENFGLMRENLMLRAVVAGTDPDQALRIAHFEVAPARVLGRVRYRVLLTRADDDAEALAGELTMDFIGERNGRTERLPLSHLATVPAYPLPMTIRTHQGFAGEVTLPDGFTPTEVRVRASLARGDLSEAAYPWPTGML